MSKTIEDFYKEYRAEINPITGKQNLFKDITDKMIWDAAVKSVEYQNLNVKNTKELLRNIEILEKTISKEEWSDLFDDSKEILSELFKIAKEINLGDNIE